MKSSTDSFNGFSTEVLDFLFELGFSNTTERLNVFSELLEELS